MLTNIVIIADNMSAMHIRLYAQQVVKVIWHKAASPPHTDGSVVFTEWRQCAPQM